MSLTLDLVQQQLRPNFETNQRLKHSLLYFTLLQLLFASAGLKVAFAPEWALSLTSALPLALQMSVLLTIRPFLPPCISSTNYDITC